MEETKNGFPSSIADQEMDVGDCSSGEDEGEGDDEEEDEEELEEDDSIEEVDSEEDIADEEDTVDDSVSLTSDNLSENVSPRQTPTTPTYENSFTGNVEFYVASCDVFTRRAENFLLWFRRVSRIRVSIM